MWQEVETLLVEFVETGAGLEADILANVVAMFPPELKEQLPEEVCRHAHCQGEERSGCMTLPCIVRNQRMSCEGSILARMMRCR